MEDNEREKYELSALAVELLRIACENDENQAIANNAALITALKTGKQLLDACHNDRIVDKLGAIDIRSNPAHFLAFTSEILNHIRRESDKLIDSDDVSTKVPIVSDFDRYALQGFAETLADIIWPERSANDFEGPSLEKCLSILAEKDVAEFYRAFIKNYIANILLHYFAAACNRTDDNDLSEEIIKGNESNLRNNDALVIATYIIQTASEADGTGTMDSKVLTSLQATL